MLSSVLFSALSVGFIVALSVSKGVINAIIDKRMNWDMIEKKGNTDVEMKSEAEVV